MTKLIQNVQAVLKHLGKSEGKRRTVFYKAGLKIRDVAELAFFFDADDRERFYKWLVRVNSGKPSSLNSATSKYERALRWLLYSERSLNEDHDIAETLRRYDIIKELRSAWRLEGEFLLRVINVTRRWDGFGRLPRSECWKVLEEWEQRAGVSEQKIQKTRPASDSTASPSPTTVEALAEAKSADEDSMMTDLHRRLFDKELRNRHHWRLTPFIAAKIEAELRRGTKPENVWRAFKKWVAEERQTLQHPPQQIADEAEQPPVRSSLISASQRQLLEAELRNSHRWKLSDFIEMRIDDELRKGTKFKDVRTLLKRFVAEERGMVSEIDEDEADIPRPEDIDDQDEG